MSNAEQWSESELALEEIEAIECAVRDSEASSYTLIQEVHRMLTLASEAYENGNYDEVHDRILDAWDILYTAERS